MGKGLTGKRLTPKQRVLRKYPGAYVWDYDFECCIFPANGASYLEQLGRGEDEKAAWADAARRLKGKP